MITEWRFKLLESFPNRMICDDGTVYNTRNGKRFNLKPSKGGYLRLRIYNNGKEFYKWVHRLVHELFIGPVEGLEVHHIDKNVRNNHYSNLLATTPKKYREFHSKTKTEDIECPF